MRAGAVPDWSGSVRRLRREELVAAPAGALFFAGLVLLTGRFGFWEGARAWVAAGAGLALAWSVVAVVALTGGRDRWRSGHLVQAALRLHADPGPELRERADAQAGHLVEVRHVGWLTLAGPLFLLAAGQWAQAPGRAAAGAVVVVALGAAYCVFWRRRVADAQRWVATPPGPPRPAPPTSAAIRWARPARVLLVVLGVLVLGVVAGVVASLV
jgi:hypothetical protein